MNSGAIGGGEIILSTLKCVPLLQHLCRRRIYPSDSEINGRPSGMRVDEVRVSALRFPRGTAHAVCSLDRGGTKRYRRLKSSCSQRPVCPEPPLGAMPIGMNSRP
jgi:hypothetical protein